MSRVTDNSFKLSLAIARVISGEATGLESKTVKEWLEVSEVNKQLFEQLQDERQLARKVDIYRSIDKQAAFKEFLEGKKRIEDARKRNRVIKMLKYAAVLILPLLAGSVYVWNSAFTSKEKAQLTEVITCGETKAVLRLSDGNAIALSKENIVLSEQNGTMISTKEHGGLVYQNNVGKQGPELIYNILEVPSNGEFFMQLADGSKVWLGACSKLKYPVAFNGDTREIYLEGEAFFDVAKNPDKPFIVKTKDFLVKALGTSFNVMNYSDESFSHTTLKTGKIEVTTQEQKLVLEPGEQVYYKDHQASVRNVDVEIYTAWMGNTFKFDKENIDVILRKIARWYDVHIFYMNESLKNYHFKGTLPKYTDIQDVLGLLEQTTDIKFEIKGNTVIVKKDLTRSDR